MGRRICFPGIGRFPLILNLLKDVIPSVAEESERPAVDSPFQDFQIPRLRSE